MHGSGSSRRDVEEIVEENDDDAAEDAVAKETVDYAGDHDYDALQSVHSEDLG